MTDDALTFEEKVSVQMAFNVHVGAKVAAGFAVHLQGTIDGLTKNNETFRQRYHDMTSEIRSLREENIALKAKADELDRYYAGWVRYTGK